MRLLCRARAYLAGLAFLAAVLAPLAPPAARAEGMQRFTGYADPGIPNDTVKPNGEIISAADAPGAFGGSIYFSVFDRTESRGDDTWDTGIKDFDKRFQPGMDDGLKPSPQLDTKARYLYLYQVDNDRGSKSPIQTVTIRLIIHPSLITSWGFFGDPHNAKHAPEVGVGFTEQEDAPDVKGGIVAVSTEHPVGPRKRPFVNDAPPIEAPHPYGLGPIGVDEPVKPIAQDSADEDVGREPVTVVLLKSADFKNAAPIHTQGRIVPYDPSHVHDAEVNLVEPEGPVNLAPAAGGALVPNAPVTPTALTDPFRPGMWNPGCGAPFGGLGFQALGLAQGYQTPSPAASPFHPVIFEEVDADGKPDPTRSPAIRAVFYDVEGDVPVEKGERSVVFGFTSNFPPSMEDGRLRGSEPVKVMRREDGMPGRSDLLSVAYRPGQRRLPIERVAAEGAANLVADADEVPTPVAFEAPPPGLGMPPGELGGGETAGGGGGGPAGGVGGGFPGLGGLGGGTSGGGGGTTGTGQQAQQQQQQQPTPTPTQTQSQTNGNAIAIAIAAQQQQQQQKQKQKQQQQQQQTPTPPSNVVPEPASYLSVLFGMPFLVLFLRRRKQAQAA